MTSAFSSVRSGSMAEEETRLIERSRGGDAAAFSQLVALHQGRVRAYIGGYISGSRRRTWSTTWPRRCSWRRSAASTSYKGDAPFGVWLLGIARHKTLMHLRGEVRRLQREIAVARERAGPVPGGDAGGRRGRSAPAGAGDRRPRSVCLESLPPGSAGLIADRYLRSRSIADIARELGKREGAIRMTLLRLRQVLRTCVETRLRQEGSRMTEERG